MGDGAYPGLGRRYRGVGGVGFGAVAVEEFSAAVFASELPTAVVESGCCHEDRLARVMVLAQYTGEGPDGVGLDALGVVPGLDDRSGQKRACVTRTVPTP